MLGAGKPAKSVVRKQLEMAPHMAGVLGIVLTAILSLQLGVLPVLALKSEAKSSTQS